MPRIIVIRKSLTAFVCGLIGVLPIIGVVPGVCALLCWARIRVRYPDEWNPASAYLSWGTRGSNVAVLPLIGHLQKTKALLGF
jgi:hypothetical protein